MVFCGAKKTLWSPSGCIVMSLTGQLQAVIERPLRSSKRRRQMRQMLRVGELPGFHGYPLVIWCNFWHFAIEHGPVEIVDLPIKHGGYFHSSLYVYQAGYIMWNYIPIQWGHMWIYIYNIYIYVYICWLVVLTCFNHLEKYEFVSWDDSNLWKMFETTNQYVEIDGNIQMILGKLRL